MNHWGITGTNGKTTTTWILAEFLNATPGRKAGSITTVEVFDGARHFYTGYTTPPLKQLHEIYAAMEANGCTDCVMEVSSHAIHQNRTGDTVFAGGAFTNLSEDHLDYHKTMAEYFRVKQSFAEKIAAQHQARPDMGRRDLPPYVVCLDGENGREMFNAVGNFAVNVIPVSIVPRCVLARGVEQPALAHPPYDLSALPLAGDYNKSNTLVAAALAEAAGVPREVIQATIPKLTPRWGRLERIENPYVAATVYIDFAHTPDGMEKVLTALRGEMTRRPTVDGRQAQLWLVFGAGGDRDPMKRPLMGEVAARLADRVVVTSDNPRSEDPNAIIAQIVAGIPQATVPRCVLARGVSRPSQPVLIADRAKAIAHALTHAQAGDIVVIAGKGHETTQEIAGVKYPFDDREVVRNFTPSSAAVG